MARPGFIAIAPSERAALRPWFADERPGPLAGSHALLTGSGFCLVDRWPEPRLVVAGAGHDVALVGAPAAFELAALAAVPRPTFIACAPAFERVLSDAVPGLFVWDRVIHRLDGTALLEAPDARLRRLAPEDEPQLDALEPDLSWISSTHGGSEGLSRSGVAWGAFIDFRLASIAVPYHMGERFEDLAVVTLEEFRGRGLSPACAARVVADVRARGRVPSWSTTPDNKASVRVAHKLGGRKDRDDVLYRIGRDD